MNSEILFKRIALIVAIAMIPIVSNAYDFMVDGLCYNYNSDGSSVSVVPQVSYSYNSDGYRESVVPDNNYLNLKSSNLIIPDSIQYKGKTYSVTSINRDAFNGCMKIESLTIGNSVKEIKRDAFIGCKNLATVNFGNSVEIIGEGSFAYCDNLKSVVVPDNVKTIGVNAFVYNTNLSSLKIGSGVESIGENAFAYCFSLEDVVFYMGNIEDIESDIFHDSPYEDVIVFYGDYFEPVYRGKQAKLCTICHGSGESDVKCKACGGYGEIWYRPNLNESYGILKGCRRCGGSGSKEMNGMTEEVYSDNGFEQGTGYMDCSACRGLGYKLLSTAGSKSKKSKTSRKKRH